MIVGYDIGHNSPRHGFLCVCDAIVVSNRPIRRYDDTTMAVKRIIHLLTKIHTRTSNARMLWIVYFGHVDKANVETGDYQ